MQISLQLRIEESDFMDKTSIRTDLMMHGYYVLVFDVLFPRVLFLFSILEVFWDERQSLIFYVLQEELHKGLVG